jgi:hypothetical protein
MGIVQKALILQWLTNLYSWVLSPTPRQMPLTSGTIESSLLPVGITVEERRFSAA